MLTKEQLDWINHLSSEKKVEIFPYNPETKNVFKIIKAEILSFLPECKVYHKGSTALGISGQGEIDLYIPVSEHDFNVILSDLVEHFGKASSIYPLSRARFVKYFNNIKIEIFLINQDGDDWKNSEKFEFYLKNNKKYLKEYERLKQEYNGFSVREYYKNKIEFINKILNIINN